MSKTAPIRLVCGADVFGAECWPDVPCDSCFWQYAVPIRGQGGSAHETRGRRWAAMGGKRKGDPLGKVLLDLDARERKLRKRVEKLERHTGLKRRRVGFQPEVTDVRGEVIEIPEESDE